VSGALTADPYLIAAAQADFTAGVVSPGDGRNAQALASLATSTVLNAGTQTPSDFLGTLGAAVGTNSLNASNRADTQEALLQAANAQQQSTSGVNLDEELTDMVRYQHAYEASAKYIQTVDEMIQALLGLLQ
jgi:flagellar hook-associated protein 1 FlgK